MTLADIEPHVEGDDITPDIPRSCPTLRVLGRQAFAIPRLHCPVVVPIEPHRKVPARDQGRFNGLSQQSQGQEKESGYPGERGRGKHCKPLCRPDGRVGTSPDGLRTVNPSSLSHRRMALVHCILDPTRAGASDLRLA